MSDEIERELSQDDKSQILKDIMGTAKRRSSIQGSLQEILEGIVFRREYPDGSPVERESVVAQALARLHSMVPEKALEKVVGVAEDESTELQIRLVLEAGTEDPRVKEADILGMFTAGKLPEPGPLQEEE